MLLEQKHHALEQVVHVTPHTLQFHKAVTEVPHRLQARNTHIGIRIQRSQSQRETEQKETPFCTKKFFMFC